MWVSHTDAILVSEQWVPQAASLFSNWVRLFSVITCFRRLARDDESWPETLAGLHLLAFSVLMLHRFTLLMPHTS
jgi:hypothetical protein